MLLRVWQVLPGWFDWPATFPPGRDLSRFVMRWGKRGGISAGGNNSCGGWSCSVCFSFHTFLLWKENPTLATVQAERGSALKKRRLVSKMKLTLESGCVAAETGSMVCAEDMDFSIGLERTAGCGRLMTVVGTSGELG